MFAQLSFVSLVSRATSAVNTVWRNTKSYFTVEPMPLWQKAMEEQGYRNYLQFKLDLKYRPAIAL